MALSTAAAALPVPLLSGAGPADAQLTIPENVPVVQAASLNPGPAPTTRGPGWSPTTTMVLSQPDLTQT